MITVPFRHRRHRTGRERQHTLLEIEHIAKVSKTPDGRLKCDCGYETRTRNWIAMRDHLIQKHHIINYYIQNYLRDFLLNQREGFLKWRKG